MKNLVNKLIYLRIVLFSVSLHFLFACNESPLRHQFSEFDREYTIKSQAISMDKVYHDGLFCFYDTLSILTRTFNEDYQIHIFNDKFKFISSSGLRGRGPGEISNPFFATIDKKDGTLWYLDMGKKMIHKFPLDSLLKNPHYLPTSSEAIPVPGEIPIFLQFYPHSEGFFSCANYFSDTDLISVFDKNGEVIDSLGTEKGRFLKNLNSKEKSVPMVTFLYQKHPTKELYVSVYKYSDIIAIVDQNGKVNAISQGPDMINQDPNDLKDNYKSSYTYVDCDEEYIYALYQGDYVVDDNMKPNYAQTIHIFNWEGQPLAKLKLDQPIATFSIQSKNKKIVGFSQSTGEFISLSIPEELF